MVFESTRVWIETLSLTIETRVLADLALALAKRYDEKGETSTAGELRKTLNELRTALAKVEEFNPLEDLLKR
jgi:hypothetical protein